ncbi:MAG: SBBP repeat-containing protein [Candidatus Thorarchaeota archaeon]|nr:SBBP repeat-containing protein [Candidatus Thorarchaeota archaeon]
MGTLFFILFLVIAPMVSILNLSFVTEVTGSIFGVSRPDLVNVDGQQSRTDADVELNMMFFAQAGPNDNDIYYVCRRGTDTIAYFGISKIQYCVGDTILSLDFPGSRQVNPIGEEPTGSVTNYLLGNSPDRWITGLEDCAVLRYGEIYPGIDLVYRLSDGAFKYEFVVSPYADPEVIQMKYSNAGMVEIDGNRLEVAISGFSFRDSGLLAFQSSMENEVSCTFRKMDRETVGFSVNRYDRSSLLTIDPVLAFSTFLGGSSSDEGRGIAVEDGFLYVTGTTSSANFPVGLGYDSSHNGAVDCFVCKFSDDGQTMVYSTYIGGSSNDEPWDIAVEDGYAYITGTTASNNYPTANAYDSTYNTNNDIFLTKLSTSGASLVYSTYIGGTSSDVGLGLAVEDDYAYVTGTTSSTNYPTVSAYDSTHNGGSDVFITKFATNGMSLAYSTFIGGTDSDSAYGLDVEDGFAYVTGFTYSSNYPVANAFQESIGGSSDSFVTKLSTNGQILNYSSYLGGSNIDWGRGIDVDKGFAYVTGWTDSADYPTANAFDSSLSGSQACFVAKVNIEGNSLVFSTYLGSDDYSEGRSIVVGEGCAFVTGLTGGHFPTINEYNSTPQGGYDCFVTMFAPDGLSLCYSRYIGSIGSDFCASIAYDGQSVYITGSTDSVGFPHVNPWQETYAGNGDCFILKIASGDSDCDAIPDWTEFAIGTNPFCIDSDGDNFLDKYEVDYGSDPLDPLSYPSMPQTWYDAIYEDLDGNATLIQNLIAWCDGNASLLETVMWQLDNNATLLTQVISWLDGNHTSIETLFTCLNGNATLLLTVVNQLNGNATRIELIAALVTQNTALIQTLNTSVIGDIDEIRDILDQLGISAGDADCDGLDDLTEISLGTDVLCIDTDCDNLNDAFEVKLGTDPLDDDSDGDTYLDGLEVIAGTNPLDALDYPGRPQGIDTTLVIIIVSGVGVVVVVMGFVLKKFRGNR